MKYDPSEHELVRNGILKHAVVIGNGYYHTLEGTNRDGQIRQVCTRGPGRQYAATRIPICICSSEVKDFIGYYETTKLPPSVILYETGAILSDVISVWFVQMPREGNNISGFEWDVPGGVRDPEEDITRIAEREFSEECDLTILAIESPFPEWLQFASGVYDEVQRIDFAIVTGKPTKLVEGARRWISVPMRNVKTWMENQNQFRDPSLWETGEFVPVDGKVFFAVSWFHDRIGSVQ